MTRFADKFIPKFIKKKTISYTGLQPPEPWPDPLYPNNLYIDKGKEIGKLVTKKNKAYGDSFAKSGNCLAQMYPNGIKPEQYDNMLYIVRVLDKLFRIATNPKAFGENPKDDIAGYSILGSVNDENKE